MSRFRRRFTVPAIVALVVWSLTTHGKFSDSGDEPHYLIVAESLFADHDLDLANNYANGDGRWFGADGLTPGPHARVNAHGALWSYHDVGLPVLILPIYAAATRLSVHVPAGLLARFHQTPGLFAYSLVSAWMILLSAGGAALLLSALRRVTAERYAVATVLALFLSPPVMGHAFLVFPETPALVVVCAVAWILAIDTRALTPWRVLPVVAAVGALPWLHHKFSFLSLGLLLLIAWRHLAWFRARPARAWTAAALGLVPQALLHVWTLAAWGSIGGAQMAGGLPFTASGFQRGLLGLLVDRERGLVSDAPVFLVVPAAWALSWRTSWRVLIPCLLLYLPMAAFVVWGAGFSPPARYLVPILPLLAFVAGPALARPILRGAAIGLAVFQAAITGYVWQHPRAMWPQELGSNAALDRVPVVGPLWARCLPSLLTGDPVWRGWLLVAAIAAASAAIVVTCRRSSESC